MPSASPDAISQISVQKRQFLQSQRTHSARGACQTVNCTPIARPISPLSNAVCAMSLRRPVAEL